MNSRVSPVAPGAGISPDPHPKGLLEALEREIMGLLVAESTLAAGLERALERICQRLGIGGGSFWRFDGASGALQERVRWPPTDSSAAQAEACGATLPSWVGEEPLWVQTLTAQEIHSQLERDTWAPKHSGLLLPMHSAAGLEGLLALRCRPDDFAAGDISGELAGLCSILGQFCGRAAAGQRLQESEQRFASTLALAAIGIAHVDDAGRFIYANPQLCAMLGYSESELLQRDITQVSHPEDEHTTDALRDQLRDGAIDSFKIEKRYLRKDGTPIWVALTIAAMRNLDGTRICDISVIEDISQRKQAEDRAQYLATHDGLTGLPNRVLFGHLLQVAIDNARRGEHQLAVLFIDLDRFKGINDSMGHEAGDLLLREMGARFQACLRGGEVVARLGGDEFAVLLPQAQRQEQVSQLARTLLSETLRPLEIQGQECRLTASLGICLHPNPEQDDRDVMKNADMAMYWAKEQGKNNFQFYSPAIQTRSAGRRAIETQLRKALARQELSLHYQPKVELGSNTITGVEALLRWTNEELGTVPPVQFIPIAEESGQIVEIGLWVLRTACQQVAQWIKDGLPAVRVSVNLSMRQLEHPTLISDIQAAIDDSGLPPDMLELELTESMIMQNAECAELILTEIKALGVRLAIDDFGTGYSSLAQLKRFPFDTLKVDRSFIRGLHSDAEDRAIIEAVIALGQSLNLTIVAEGVETGEQRAFLLEHACDEMQGYFFSSPVSSGDFADLLRGASGG